MSLANPTVHVPDTRVSAPTWLRRHLSWVLVGLAVVAAAAVLAVSLAGSGDAADTAPTGTGFYSDRGSITAIDHGATSSPATPSGASTQPRESITAIDHRTATQGG